MFVMFSWMRIGLRQVLQASELMEDDAPYAHQFRLAELIDIMGLDVALDEKTLERLRAVLTRPSPTHSSRKTSGCVRD
jgi:hypothetical protein